jgi:hypothetical protein
MFTGYPADVPDDVRRSVDAFVVKGDPADKLLQTIRELIPVNGNGAMEKAAGQVRRSKRNNRTATSARHIRRPA